MKEFEAVLLRASSSRLDKFLQALRLNLVLKRVILLSVLVIFSVPNKVFSITFLSPCMIKCLKLSRTKESNKQNISFWFSIEYAPPMSTSFIRTVCIGYDRRIFSSFIRYHSDMIYEFVHMVRLKNTNKIVIDIFIIHIFQSIFYLKMTYDLVHFLLYTTKKIISTILCFILCLCHYVICKVRIKSSVDIFIFDFRCSKSTEIFFFFNYQAVNFSEICQSYRFYFF